MLATGTAADRTLTDKEKRETQSRLVHCASQSSGNSGINDSGSREHSGCRDYGSLTPSGS